MGERGPRRPFSDLDAGVNEYKIEWETLTVNDPTDEEATSPRDGLGLTPEDRAALGLTPLVPGEQRAPSATEDARFTLRNVLG